MVTKKDEYKKSFLAQVRRNIKYYIGNDSKISLKDWKLELVSYYYDSLHKFSVQQIKESFDLLDHVTRRMIKMDNPNRDANALITANKEKKDHLLRACLSTFPYYKGCRLLLISGFPHHIPRFILGKVFRVIKRHPKYPF